MPAAMALPMTPLAPVTMATGFSSWFVRIMLNTRGSVPQPEILGEG
jgi:hypothetical protein